MERINLFDKLRVDTEPCRSIKETISKIKPINKEVMKKARERLDNLTKPLGSLGRIEEIAERISGIKGHLTPVIKQKVIFILAGDHGVVAEGVSAYPVEVTAQMVYNFAGGGAGINVLARHVGARIIVVDMGVATDLEPRPEIVNKKVAYGTKNIARGPAMSYEQAIQSIKTGMELVEDELSRGVDIIGTGDMGIGNTTSSSAITAAITGTDVREVTGRGTGIDDAILEHKIEVIRQALEINQPNPRDLIDTLAKVGGFEIGGLVGVILAGAAHQLPVVLDGFIVGAAGLIAYSLAPQVKDYLFAAHCSVERGHKIILDKMGLEPLFDLELRLGEGTGAALGIGIIEAATKILNEMATFEEASVSKKL
ncbi:MAG: nicotinate-nucleotide--dimethylbenzimidazole phosphoribosyltransferase [Candidatus Doudnabacteria bacterium]